ncbi:prephenate/arogenate dehydrogenase [Prochlorococcus marinus]|uniref:Arogenate dehydrogenase n=1 Tax=Prochlorococcus marinus XMU1408 TaxID=2213228 RepID=A0A318R6B9_PROMR|nr:prephenate/arogenate dehydrogenase [Prochlorococcus marinus]MBW3042785.1 arogenate dehydrogenase [Prochlorococcus marinus str. XMU1408]PYE00612.1 arogenate dehydrogenase [Prochlorococcus marinus XMU1408]
MELKSKPSKNIGIVGLGLIGGSLGLDLQKLGYTVYGVTHREKTAIKARERKLAQIVSTDPDILKDCSVIYIALPLDQLLKPSSILINAIPRNAVVTDVGSVKVPILNTWKSLHPRFIASHPMTGTEESGVNAGQHNLFKNKPWVVTPDKETDQKALEIIHQISLSLGCKWISAEAQIHDEAVSLISHLPVLISAALLNTLFTNTNPSIYSLTKSIASNGFADTSRVGGGNPALGVSMAKLNKKNLMKNLLFYRHSLDLFEKYLLEENWNELENILIRTQEGRKNFIS